MSQNRLRFNTQALRDMPTGPVEYGFIGNRSISQPFEQLLFFGRKLRDTKRMRVCGCHTEHQNILRLLRGQLDTAHVRKISKVKAGELHSDL
jgi:hypothetical protein